jgi:nitroimidazol reductase NimA-like FMN-containing flavoprotein (pyridoxamine 5'-phosphate oxidase superfamily)
MPEPAESATAPSDRIRVRRIPELGAYDRPTIDAILDAGIVAHLGFTHEGHPLVIPTLHARIDDLLYVHGSAASRTLKSVAEGIPVCVTVTLLDGIVLARSIFEHSIDYRSVVVLGTARLVDDPEEKLAALHAFSEQVLPGRWDDCRPPNDQELKATSILSLPLTEASAKVSAGPPEDGDSPDGALDVWAGNIPLVVTAKPPVPDPALRPGIPVPRYAADFHRPGLTD